MSNDFVPFWKLIVAAEHMLQSAEDPDGMEEMAQALIRRQPGSGLAERLLEQAAYLRTVSRHMRGSGAAQHQQTRLSA